MQKYKIWIKRGSWKADCMSGFIRAGHELANFFEYLFLFC